MWLDTHCHLDAAEFDPDREAVIQAAHQAGVQGILIPAVQTSHFAQVKQLAQGISGAAYTLGIHPLYVPKAQALDLILLEKAIEAALEDPKFVGIGEIGLDFFVPELCTAEMLVKQNTFYLAQLKLAKRYQLPVILHVRRSQDALLKGLRQIFPQQSIGGIVHAFNGSHQQATQFIELGFALGFGGAMTFPQAKQIHRLAEQVPAHAIVLETDAPDIPPQWLYTPHAERLQGKPQGRNTPSEIPKIAEALAVIRAMSLDALATLSTHNARRVLPRWRGDLV